MPLGGFEPLSSESVERHLQPKPFRVASRRVFIVVRLQSDLQFYSERTVQLSQILAINWRKRHIKYMEC